MHKKPTQLLGPLAAPPAPQGALVAAKPVFARVGATGEITISGALGDWYGEYSLEQFQKDFSALVAQGVDAVNINLNTPGGSVSDAFGMYDIIRSAGVPVHAYVNGLCASAGTIVAAAAQDITMAPLSQWMVHEPTGGAYGTLAECQMAIDYFAKLRDDLIDIYVARTGLSSEDVVQLMNPGKYLSASEALDGHWVDAIGVNPAHAGCDPKEEEEAQGGGNEPAKTPSEASPADPAAPAPREEEKRLPQSAHNAPRSFFSSVAQIGDKIAHLFRPENHPTAEQLLASSRQEVAGLNASLNALQRQNEVLRDRLDALSAQQGAQLAAAALTTAVPTPPPAEPSPAPRRPVTQEECRAAARNLR